MEFAAVLAVIDDALGTGGMLAQLLVVGLILLVMPPPLVNTDIGAPLSRVELVVYTQVMMLSTAEYATEAYAPCCPSSSSEVTVRHCRCRSRTTMPRTTDVTDYWPDPRCKTRLCMMRPIVFVTHYSNGIVCHTRTSPLVHLCLLHSISVISKYCRGKRT